MASVFDGRLAAACKVKIMIYTTCELINGRSAKNGPISRTAGQNAEDGHLSICVETGIKRAPIRHKTPGFGASVAGPEGRETLVFSETFAMRPLFACAPRAAI
jgi:hypothetical protein